MKACKIISILVVHSFLFIISLNATFKPSFIPEPVGQEQGVGVKTRKSVASLSEGLTDVQRYSQRQKALKSNEFRAMQAENLRKASQPLNQAGPSIPSRQRIESVRLQGSVPFKRSDSTNIANPINFSAPGSLPRVSSQLQPLREQSVNFSKLTEMAQDDAQPGKVVTTHENTAAQELVARIKLQDIVRKVIEDNKLAKSTASQSKPTENIVNQKPQEIESPKSSKSITEEPLPTENARIAMINQKGSEDVVKNRLAEAIGISDLFDVSVPRLNTNDFGNKQKEVVLIYQSMYKDSLIDPIIKLKQDVKTLQLYEPYIPAAKQNKGKAIAIADKAVAEMTQEIINESSPLAGVSIYEVVATLENNIKAIKRIQKDSLSISAEEMGVCDDYVKTYDNVLKSLEPIQDQVLELEGDRKKIDIFSEEFIDSARTKVADLLSRNKDNNTLNQAQAQIELDSVIQQKAMDYVHEKVDKILTDHDFLSKIKETNPDASCDATVKEVVMELQKVLKDYSRTLDVLKKKESDDVIKDLNKIFDTINSKIGTLDLQSFIDKTKDLRVYIEVINKLIKKRNSLNKQVKKDDSVTSRGTQYVENVLNKPILTEKYVASLLNGTSNEPKVGNALKKSNESIISIYDRLKKKTNKNEPADRKDIQEFNKKISEKDMLSLRETKIQELVDLYGEIITKLEERQENLRVDETIEQDAKNQAKALLKKYQKPGRDDVLQLSITEVLNGLIQPSLIELPQETTTIIREIVDNYNIRKDAVEVRNEVYKKLFEPIESDKDTMSKDRSYGDNAIIVCYKTIEKLIYDDNLYQKTHADVFTNRLDKLKRIVQVGQSFTGWGWENDEINKARIMYLKGKLHEIPELSLNGLIDDFNSNITDKDMQIPKDTTREEYEYILNELLKKELSKIDETSQFRGLKWIKDTVWPTSKKVIILTAAEQQALDEAQQGVQNATTVEEQNTALHNLVRVILNMNYVAAVVVTTLGGAGGTIALIIQFHAALNSQINNNNNLTDDEKKKLIDESNATMMMDIFNAIAAEKSGADMTSIQSGDAQSIAESMAFNKAINLLDPTMQYNSSNSADALINSKAFADSYNAWLKQQAQNKSTGTGKSSTVIYPSYQDLLAMENAHNASTTNYGTTSPSYSYSPSTSSSSSQTKTSTTYNPYTSSPYASVAG
ncbi:MAG: hypothetical protein Q8Q60_00125 [Candidatus Chromulinivorax sp.]|nr:hypothetical protein [Candidatus Chromulinivorax sp.]